MTAEYVIANLIRVGGKMRTAQRGFFGSKAYEQDKRQAFLRDSKEAERQFDALLSEADKFLKQSAATRS